MKPGDKLYIVVDGTLPPGLQIAQSIHAAREFAHEHVVIEQEWFVVSNTVAVLTTDGESTLESIEQSARIFDVPFSVFCEPDLQGRTTAIALAPHEFSGKICRGLKMALQT